MTRLIDADALEQAVQGSIAEYGDAYTGEMIFGMRSVVYYATNDAPTVDVEPCWIPCNERLPEDDRSKVVTLANGITEVGYYSNGDWWCIGDTFTLENPTVVAWMPLPKPYEVEDEKTD